MTTATQKPLRERIIHLLALKPYRKPELLLWLERERAGPNDKAKLGAILEEVRTCTQEHFHACMHSLKVQFVRIELTRVFCKSLPVAAAHMQLAREFILLA